MAPALAPEPSPVLDLRQLRVRYPGAPNPTLDGLDLRLGRGDRMALVGPSGCGKSTVARAVLQLLPPGSVCEGTLLLAGQDPRQLDQTALRRLRGEAVGLVFQDPMTRLNPLLTVGEHLRDTLASHRPGGAPGPGRHRTGPLQQLPP
jgi:peptide/nickel transport system ATP-binding protein